MTEDLLALTRRLVRIPSAGDEAAAGRALAEWLRTETDAHVRIDDAGNVVARRTAATAADGSGPAAADGGDPAGTTGPTLALVGHHDVVAPADDQVAARDADGTPTEYTVERRDGRLYGRGTADMKGPLAAMAVAFRDADLPDPPTGDARGSGAGRLVFASFAGEEAGGIGAQHAVNRGFAPTYALVGEGSTGYSAAGVTDVAVAHRGRRGSRVVARGEAAHAGEPDAGDNAIYRAADAVRAIRDLATPTATVLGHELQGTVSVTEIEGGSGHNVVPERCALTIDERTVPEESVDLEGVVADDPALSRSVESDVPPMACSEPAFADAVLAVARDVATHTDGAAGAVDSGAEDAGAAASGAPEHVVKPHATDAGWLASAGTACVICGAAEPGEAHTAGESVSIDVLRRCEEIYRRAVPKVLGGGTHA